MIRRGDRMIVAIGVFKLVKTCLLVALGLFVLFEGDGRAQAVANVARWTGAFSGHHLVQRALTRLLSVPERTMHRFAIASIVYAGVFATEGVGLIRRKRWAEWFTIGVTGSFVPLEVYELVHRPSAPKVVALAINVAIVAYLLWQRRTASRAA